MLMNELSRSNLRGSSLQGDVLLHANETEPVHLLGPGEVVLGDRYAVLAGAGVGMTSNLFRGVKIPDGAGFSEDVTCCFPVAYGGIGGLVMRAIRLQSRDNHLGNIRGT